MNRIRIRFFALSVLAMVAGASFVCFAHQTSSEQPSVSVTNKPVQPAASARPDSLLETPSWDI